MKNRGEIERIFGNIYSSSVATYNREWYQLDRKDSVLDLGIKIKVNRFSIVLYYKRDDFHLSFVRMLY